MRGSLGEWQVFLSDVFLGCVWECVLTVNTQATFSIVKLLVVACNCHCHFPSQCNVQYPVFEAIYSHIQYVCLNRINSLCIIIICIYSESEYHHKYHQYHHTAGFRVKIRDFNQAFNLWLEFLCESVFQLKI